MASDEFGVIRALVTLELFLSSGFSLVVLESNIFFTWYENMLIIFLTFLPYFYHYYSYWCNKELELNTLYNKETTYTPQLLEMLWPRPWYFITMLCNVGFFKKRNPSPVHIKGFWVSMMQNSFIIIRIFSFDTKFAQDNCVVWVLLFGQLGPNFYYD